MKLSGNIVLRINLSIMPVKELILLSSILIILLCEISLTQAQLPMAVGRDSFPLHPPLLSFSYSIGHHGRLILFVLKQGKRLFKDYRQKTKIEKLYTTNLGF